MSNGFDIGPILRGLETSREKFLAPVIQAVGEFGAHVMGDAQQLCPVLTGALQASASLGEVKADGESVSVEIGFNTEYAAAVHENLEANHTVGQAKYLETAIREDGPRFGPYVAEKVKAATF